MEMFIIAVLKITKKMQNTVLNFYPIKAKKGMDSGIVSLLLHYFSTILTKSSGFHSDLITQLKAMYSAFIGTSHSRENFVKIVVNGE
jgi:hypothetical protein